MEGYYKKGAELLQQRKFQEAYEAFSLAIEAEPSRAEIYGERAICLLNLNKQSLALIDLNKAVELQPDYSYRYAARAFCKDGLGDTEGAIEDYKKAVELDPEDSIAYNNLGLLEEKLGYKSAAQKRFEKADQLSKKEGFKPLINEEKSSKEKEEFDVPSKTFFQIIKEIFTDKSVFREYINFIKNGFKNK